MKYLTFAALISLAFAPIAGTTVARADDKSPEGRVFELRTYTTNDGKLDALHKRFRDHTNKLFVKHGMTLIAYWTPTDEPKSANTLVYVLAYKDKAARAKAWNAFKNDPDWKKAFAESRKDGPIVKKVQSMFLSPTDYSPVK